MQKGLVSLPFPVVSCSERHMVPLDGERRLTWAAPFSVDCVICGTRSAHLPRVALCRATPDRVYRFTLLIPLFKLSFPSNRLIYHYLVTSMAPPPPIGPNTNVPPLMDIVSAAPSTSISQRYGGAAVVLPYHWRTRSYTPIDRRATLRFPLLPNGFRSRGRPTC